MANLRGVADTGDYESGIKKLDVRDFIFLLETDEAPLISLLSKVRKEACQDVEFSWFEDRLVGKYTAINCDAGYADHDTDLVVVDADIFMAGDVAKLETDEVVRITAVNPATNTITVVRGWGTTAADAILDHCGIYRLGNAQAESYTAPDALLTAKSKVSNYVQLFSKTVQFSDTADAVATYGGNRRNYERKRKALELKRDIESQFLFGELKLDTSGSSPRYQTKGIWSFIRSTAPNLNAGGVALAQDHFDAWLSDVFAYGGKERFLFCGPLAISQINQWAGSAIQMNPGAQKTYGIRFPTYTSTFGDVHLVLSQQFSGPFAHMAVCLDIKELVYRYLKGLDFTLALDIQPKNAHYKQDEYFAQIGLEIHSPLRHGTIVAIGA